MLEQFKLLIIDIFIKFSCGKGGVSGSGNGGGGGGGGMLLLASWLRNPCSGHVGYLRGG